MTDPWRLRRPELAVRAQVLRMLMSIRFKEVANTQPLVDNWVKAWVENEAFEAVDLPLIRRAVVERPTYVQISGV